VRAKFRHIDFSQSFSKQLLNPGFGTFLNILQVAYLGINRHAGLLLGIVTAHYSVATVTLDKPPGEPAVMSEFF